MRTWSIIFGMVIFICVVTVSFSHTVALYERVGFAQWEAVLITIAVETTFLLSGWSILWYRYRGQHPGGPSYAGFIYGVVIVLFSNSAYTVGLDALFENKIAQWTLAWSVVVGVLISEAIISRNLTQWTGWPATNHDKQSAESTNQPADNRSNQSASSANHPTTASQVADHQPTSHPGGRKVADQPTGQISQQSAAVNRSISQPNQPVAESVSQVAEVAEKAVEAERPAANQVAETASQSTAKSASSRPTVSQPSATNRTKVVDMTDRKVADRKVVEVAEKYYQETGQLPSRRQLAEMAGCTPYRASKAIDHLKEKYNIDSANKSASGR